MLFNNMKPRYYKRQFTDIDSVDYFVAQGVPLPLAQALNARGISAADFPYYFGKECFHSPFEMTNMQEAAETISYILEEGGSVLICGDYDTDGLTASSLLSLFFTDNGIDNDVIVPTREKGYGLHADMVLQAFEKKFYDLIITVDCGISNKEEVAIIQRELDAEIIVTDHHELPEELPNCLCVNPKMGYPFPNLSGSGVAWKLVEALVGREVAAKYSDLAMLGTIGDIMPMQDENRSLVKLGLANWHHKSLLKLCEMSRASSQPSATEISMKISPMINAAGRMGDPILALKLLLCRDRVNVALADKLYQTNEQRKVVINRLKEQCDAMCNAEQICADRITFLYGEDWPIGLLGILASNYKEKYGYPTVVLTKDEEKGVYVGSARGVDGLDLFDAFSNRCKDLLVKCGGHKSAVGFSVTEENLLTLKNRLSQCWQHLDKSIFEKVFYYDIDLENGCNVADMFDFAQKLEPTLSQDKLLFHVSDVVKMATPFGKTSSGLNITLSSGLELVAYGKYYEYMPFIRNGANIEAIISLSINSYTNKLTGTVEDMRLCNSVCFDEFYKLNFLENFRTETQPSCSKTQVEQILAGNSVLVVFDDYETYLRESDNFNLDDYYVDIFFDNSQCSKTVVVSPLQNYGFAKYQSVVVFAQSGTSRVIPNATYYFVEGANKGLYQVKLDRSVCAAVFSKLKNKSPFDSIRGVYDKYLLGKVSYAQYRIAIRVFQELKLIEVVDKYTVNFPATAKTDLANSAIYRYFAE